MTWQFWGILVRYIVGCFFLREWGICFSFDKIKVLGFGRKTTKVKYHFHQILWMVHWFCDGWCWPGSPGWGSVCVVFPFPRCACWKPVVRHSWCLRNGRWAPPPPGWSVYIIIRKSSAWEVCLFSPAYIFIKSFIYISIDSWIFILYFELESNIILFRC